MECTSTWYGKYVSVCLFVCMHCFQFLSVCCLLLFFFSLFPLLLNAYGSRNYYKSQLDMPECCNVLKYVSSFRLHYCSMKRGTGRGRGSCYSNTNRVNFHSSITITVGVLLFLLWFLICDFSYQRFTHTLLHTYVMHESVCVCAHTHIVNININCLCANNM